MTAVLNLQKHCSDRLRKRRSLDLFVPIGCPYSTMSGPPQTRGLIAAIFRNFFNSFKVLQRETKGQVVGRDPFGNTYYQLPADPQRGKRRESRWYENVETNRKDAVGREVYAGFDATLPSEWEAWLRFRRADPPTDEQVLRSLAIADMKKRNAAKLEEKRVKELIDEGRYEGDPKPQDHEKPFYPKYAEYEVMPGEKEVENYDKWKEFKNPYHKKPEEKP